MFLFQAQIIFPTEAVPPPGPLPPRAERLELTTGDGKQLHGVHIPPARTAVGERQRTLVLGFAGNAWNSEDVASLLHSVLPQADIVTFHYRGYRPSTGVPSARALVADAPLVYDLAVGGQDRHRHGRTVERLGGVDLMLEERSDRQPGDHVLSDRLQ